MTNSIDHIQKLDNLISRHKNTFINVPRKILIQETIDNKEAAVSQTGALSVRTPPESTGRSPKNTYIVQQNPNIDWNSSTNIPMDIEVFNKIFNEATEILSKSNKVYILNRSVGAGQQYALNVKLITNQALPALFAKNMFFPAVASSNEFTLIALPYNKPKEQSMVIAMDMQRKLGLVYGSAYCGSVKKLIFTVMNYLLPEKGILPLHCSANEGKKGDLALFLGLSGTGKTTLSADPKRALLGDDEHGWSDQGIANFENGCYAKLISLNPEKEPEIFKAVFTKRNYSENGCIIENAKMLDNGTFDLTDGSYTQNSRASYPLKFLSNIKYPPLGPPPKYIIFLTADANGALPPVAKLDIEQAIFWFLLGYTSKLAGTETGIKEPISVFSRFFGQPFFPRNPKDYTNLLKAKIQKHKTQVYLINTGWSGGPYGVGKRIDINVSRTIIDAVLNGDLENVTYSENKKFHFFVPKTCPGIATDLLNPKNTWNDKKAYEKRANKLALEFSEYFNKEFSTLHFCNS